MDSDSWKTGIVASAVQSAILHEVDSVGEVCCIESFFCINQYSKASAV